MLQDRLVGLTLLCIDCNILLELNSDDVTDDFANEKARKVSLQILFIRTD